MKKLFTLTLIALALLNKSSQAQYPSQNITLLSVWNDPAVVSEPGYGIRYNSIWGYHDAVKNKEYAIIGSTHGTYFIEVTNPAAPVQRDFVPGRRDSCIWREYKTYGKYLYMVSDDQKPNSMQIMDMSYLPDSVKVVHDNDAIVQRSHTLFIDKDNLYLGSGKLTNTGVFASMAVMSLSNPAAPSLIRKLSDDYPSIGHVHDMFVRNDTVYASCGNDGLHIYKFTGTNFVELGSLTNYPQGGYNHSSALSPDGKKLYFADEVPVNLAMKSIDIGNLSNITVLDTFRSSFTATPHNPFMAGKDRVVVAYYQDGLQIFDVSNPSNVTVAGYIDTNPTNGAGLPNPSYSGCWGAYVDLPSGIILASDMQKGLFVLDASVALGIKQTLPKENNVTVFPNPSRGNFTLLVDLVSGEEVTYEVLDITGKRILFESKNLNAGSNRITLNGEKLSSGSYVVKVTGSSFEYSEKLIKTK